MISSAKPRTSLLNTKKKSFYYSCLGCKSSTDTHVSWHLINANQVIIAIFSTISYTTHTFYYSQLYSVLFFTAFAINLFLFLFSHISIDILFLLAYISWQFQFLFAAALTIGSTLFSYRFQVQEVKVPLSSGNFSYEYISVYVCMYVWHLSVRIYKNSEIIAELSSSVANK